MASSSRKIDSNQPGIHEDLAAIVAKHLNSDFRKPVAQHNATAYQLVMQQINGRPLILDSGCGNAASTLKLATQFPDAYVIGIDKSAHRISKRELVSISSESTVLTGDNYAIVRADLIDFWRLCARDKVKLARHFILYPNPWPKKHHLKRRWHGSPVYRQLLALGGSLEMRSNWEIYLQEFAHALTIAGFQATIDELSLTPELAISDFEAKYHASGHGLWRLKANLDIDSTVAGTENRSSRQLDKHEQDGIPDGS